MNYPLISEYIEAISSAEDNFEELSYLRPVLDNEGRPIMSAGGFSVVFKMKDEQDGKLYAVKCFTKEQEGRDEAYREISKQLKRTSSSYLVPIRYLEKELFVDTNQTTETEFPVLLMDWVEGKTLDNYIREHLDDKLALEMLSYSFYRFATWLISQPFAHGDLKPDNIIVKEDNSIVMVDYDGMYVPAMYGQKARETGSPDFRHPKRDEKDFDGTIDHFSLVSILLSLCAIHIEPDLFSKYCEEGRLLFSANDYLNINNCEAFNNIPRIVKTSTNYCKLLQIACDDKHLSLSSYMPHRQLTYLLKPSVEKRTISTTAIDTIKKEPQKRKSSVRVDVIDDTFNNGRNKVSISPKTDILFIDDEYYKIKQRNEEIRKRWREEEERKEQTEKEIIDFLFYICFIIILITYIIGSILLFMHLYSKSYDEAYDYMILLFMIVIWGVITNFMRLYILYVKNVRC